jgi:hypothetical protein
MVYVNLYGVDVEPVYLTKCLTWFMSSVSCNLYDVVVLYSVISMCCLDRTELKLRNLYGQNRFKVDKTCMVQAPEPVWSMFRQNLYGLSSKT